jgi:hypothetical protein
LLRDEGRRAAGAFLPDKGDDLGIRSSMDIDQLLKIGDASSLVRNFCRPGGPTESRARAENVR